MNDVFSVKQYASILADELAWMVANQSTITDFNEGAALRTFAEAVALELEQIYIRGRTSFKRGLLAVPFAVFDFTQHGAQAATGAAYFSCAVATLVQINIPIGTIVSTASGIQFATTSLGIITVGNTVSNLVSVMAVKKGITGNVPINTINVIITPVPGVTAVINSAAGTQGGLNQESNAAYLTRFLSYLEGLAGSNNAGLLSAALAVTGVRSATVVENFPPIANINVYVYIDDGTGTPSAALIALVQAKVVGDGTEASPGYKAGGVQVQTLAPTVVLINITAVVTQDGTLSAATVLFNVQAALTNYVNGLPIGGDVILNKLIAVIMDQAGVLNVAVSIPAADVVITTGQVARMGVMSITVV